MDKFNPSDFINFGSLSRLFANNRSSITRTKPGSKKDDIADLLKAINNWHDNLTIKNKLKL